MSEKYTEEEHALLCKIGVILREHRRKCKLTQEQTAEMAGLNVTYLSDVERGKRNICLINLARLAQAFDLPLEYIFTPTARRDKDSCNS